MRRVPLIFLFAFANGHVATPAKVEQSSVSTAPVTRTVFPSNTTERQKDTAQQPLAFAFAPAGLLFPYYVGVAYQLRDLGLLQSSTPIGGASAGSIVAAAIAFGIEESEVRASMMRMMENVRSGKELKNSLRQELEMMIPKDEVVRAQKRLAIAYYEVLPQRRPHIVTSWESKKDLIETILASCNFPIYFGRLPLVKCRDAWAIDGVFAPDESTRLGCPPRPDFRTIAVLATPNVSTSFPMSDVIQPRIPGMELPKDMSHREWLFWSLTPAPKEKLDEMMGLGRLHARAWAVAQKSLSVQGRVLAVEQNIFEALKEKTVELGKLLPTEKPEPQPIWQALWQDLMSPQPSQTSGQMSTLLQALSPKKPEPQLQPWYVRNHWTQQNPQPHSQLWPLWPEQTKKSKAQQQNLWSHLTEWTQSLSPKKPQPKRHLWPLWQQPSQPLYTAQNKLPQFWPLWTQARTVPSMQRLMLAQTSLAGVGLTIALLMGLFTCSGAIFALLRGRSCFRHGALIAAEEPFLGV